MNTPQDSTHRPAAGRTPGSPVAAGRTAADAEALAEQARTEGQVQVQHYREVAADKVETLADSVKAAASELQDDDVAQLSRHISDMAGGLSRLAEGLREKSTDQILRDVRRVARENPALFIAGSIALGFGITRFARASASSSEAGRDEHARSPARGRPDRARRTDAASAVPGTATRPATASDTLGTGSPGGLTGAIPAAPGPAASTADAISARAGAAASDSATREPDVPSSTDTPRGRNQP